MEKNRIGMPQGVTESENPYIGWYKTPFLNVDYLRTSVDDPSTDEAIKKGRESLNKYTAYPLHTGFYPDFREMQAICNDRASIYINRIDDALDQGKYDVNETDNIIEELKNAGTGKIVDETQRQLNEWRAKNRK